MFGWNWLGGSGEEVNMSKVYKQMDGQTGNDRWSEKLNSFHVLALGNTTCKLQQTYIFISLFTVFNILLILFISRSIITLAEVSILPWNSLNVFLLLINIINLFSFIHVDQSVASEFERLHVCKKKLMQFNIHYQ